MKAFGNTNIYISFIFMEIIILISSKYTIYRFIWIFSIFKYSILDLSKNKLDDPTIVDILEKMPNLVLLIFQMIKLWKFI